MAQISLKSETKSDYPLSLRLSKGIGKLSEKPPLGTSSLKKWNILQENISLPAAILDINKFNHNLAWMEEFITKFDEPILLAPHGKTSMMPDLFNQVCNQSSTWGITLATASQVKIAHEFGVSKILLANQLVGKRNMEIISEIMTTDENFDFLCIIDSVENLQSLGQFFSRRNQKLKVLLEYGPRDNGRTGIRNQKQESELLTTLKTLSETIHVVGVEFFEGVLTQEQEVSDFIDYVTERTSHLINSQAFFPNNFPVIISGSGSAWFDIVAQKLATFSKSISTPLQIILRPGCYMIHDVGMYTHISARLQTKQFINSELQPALKLWAYVQSIPEKNLAIVGLGRRDAGNDSGYPKPALHFRPVENDQSTNNEKKRMVPEHWELFRMMDQHSFMRIGEEDDILVGDIVAFDIIHACTTFDKWRNVLVMDNEKDMNIVNVYPTFF